MLSTAYKRYALATVTTVYGVNLLDRGLMSMFLQPIKEDLQLTDTQLGLVTGIAFAFFFATVGVPIARWADRGNRITITSLAIGVWGITAMACSFVTSFAQLVLARVIAGIGDAGCKPPIYSLLGDYFPQAVERNRALYVFESCVPIAGLLSYAASGWLSENYGWRTAFLMIGVPGLLLAVLVKWTLIEPRNLGKAKRAAAQPLPPMRQVLAILWNQHSCRHLTVAMILMFTMGQGLVTWYGAFMMRTHGIGAAELGVWLGAIFGIAGLAGLAIGGYIVDRWFKGNEAGQMRLASISLLVQMPSYIAFLTLSHPQAAMLALIPQVLVGNAFLTLTFVLLQRLVPGEMRATVMMVMLFLANLIGMGIGPQAVGALSDLLMPAFGVQSLRYAMLTLVFLAVWAAFHLWKVGRAISRDLIE